MPVAIPLIAAGVGAAGAVYSSSQARRGQQAAATASQNATDAATAEQRRQYDLSRGDNAPWLNAGRGALAQLAGLYGISTGAPAAGAEGAMTQPYPATGGPVQGGPNTGVSTIFGRSDSLIGRNTRANDVAYGGAADPTPWTDPGNVVQTAGAGDQPQINGGLPTEMGANGQPVTPTVTPNPNPTTGTAGPGGSNSPFWASPDYQFRLNEQNRALTARNAALGIQDSGAAQRSALQLSGNLAAGEYNNYANRLAALAGVGQTAASQNQQLGQNYANSYGNLLTNNAQNLATSYQNQGAINGQLGQYLAGTAGNLINRYWN